MTGDPFPVDATLSHALTFATSAAVGLLVGLERERNPTAKAGVRTFALIALLGTLAAMLSHAAGSGWVVAIGLGVTGLTLAGAHLADPRTAQDDGGTTTVVAALVVFCLGAANYYGHRTLVVATGIAMTALLHFKVELEGAARRLTPGDIRSILQFGAVSAVILPLLPNQAYGPYAALNPFHVWLMVVLISGVSLAGYVAWRLIGDRRGLVLTGLLGGIVSSTATTLVYARHARRGAVPHEESLVVITLANGAMLARVLLVALIVAPGAVSAVAIALVPALVLAALTVFLHWRAVERPRDPAGRARAHDYRNPANLMTAIAFGAGYAVVLLLAAFLADRFGSRGLYGLALVSGLTDVDAIALSSLRLFGQGALPGVQAATAIALAVGANFVTKAALVAALGGAALRRTGAVTFLLPTGGLAVGVSLLHAWR